MKTIMTCLGCAMLVLSANAEALQVEDNVIILRVTGEPPNEQLEVNPERTKTKKCSKNDHPGCVEVSLGNMAKFTVRLPGGLNECESDEDRWSISKVLLGGELAGTDFGPKPGPGHENWGKLTNASSDFAADATTGEVNTTKSGSNGVIFYDSNNYRYTVWYTVVVENCRDQRTLQLDPGVGNRGK